MPTGTTFLTFIAATVAILVVPGPSVIYVIARSIEQGRTAGLLSMLGLETGALLHVFAAAIGLAALLESSPAALHVIRYGGAAYLLYLGARQFRTIRSNFATSHRKGTLSAKRLYVDGVLVDLFNPKTALFFIAFLPQFIDPSRGPAAGQVIALGLCFVALAVVCDSCYAIACGRFGERISSSSQSQIHMATGAVYVGLAGLTVVA